MVNHRYLIKTREFFDDDEKISHVAILKSEGYLESSAVEFSKFFKKNFSDQHDFSDHLKANIIDKHRLNVNSFIIKKIDRKKIFYISGSQVRTLYYLEYK